MGAPLAQSVNHKHNQTGTIYRCNLKDKTCSEDMILQNIAG